MKKSKTKMLSLAVLTTAIVCLYACKENVLETLSERPSYEINFVPAKTSNELKALVKDESTNIIRSLDDLDRAVASKRTPLSKLPNDVLQKFRSEIVVREGVGVASLRYSDIMASLSEDDFHAVMELFGLDTKDGFWGFSKNPDVVSKLSIDTNLRGSSTQTIMAEDYKGYYCSNIYKHTCSKSSDNICLSTC